MDVSMLCRLCLADCSKKAFAQPIFDDQSTTPSIALRIMACCSVEVSTGDALPKNLCPECRYQLDKTYIFRTKSKNAEAKLKRHIRLTNQGKPSHVLDEEDEEDDYQFAIDYVKEQDAVQSSAAAQQLRRLEATVQQLKHSEAQLQAELNKLNEKLLETEAALLATQQEEDEVEMEETDKDTTEYVIEMLEEEDPKVKIEEPLDLEAEVQQEEEEEEGTVVETVVEAAPRIRYECDSEEYSAIEKAVRVGSFSKLKLKKQKKI